MIKRFAFEPRWFVVLIFTLAGIFIGVLGFSVWLFSSNAVFGLQKIHPATSKYIYINPLLAVDISERKDFLEDQPLSYKVNKIITDSIASGVITQAAVYFKDIEAGRWMGINPDVKFSPGLILKVPLMMAYFKLAEINSTYLTHPLQYTGNSASDRDSIKIEAGHSYTALELIKSMIIDNNDQAAEILFDNINLDSLNDVYSDIGINLKEDKVNEDYITLKQSTLTYRILYNATYLNREYSEQALAILSQVPLTDGLAAPLPNDLGIAHRFRFRNLGDQGNNLVESNSCGIIYYPGYPYTLCILTISKSNDVDNFLSQVSELVYNDMKDHHGK